MFIDEAVFAQTKPSKLPPPGRLCTSRHFSRGSFVERIDENTFEFDSGWKLKKIVVKDCGAPIIAETTICGVHAKALSSWSAEAKPGSGGKLKTLTAVEGSVTSAQC
ncbi:hypothetical protein H6P81_002047 [Aristolochia fimbriata]|uniref:Uncharacterized protein n=1 Tax=Aristolochia fimbriata TaxID=158543 RepID=A0AAV7FAD2_ARIFI|nr:hypothetical protein H6P81_002047 [Aristolochia fimbriata]